MSASHIKPQLPLSCASGAAMQVLDDLAPAGGALMGGGGGGASPAFVMTGALGTGSRFAQPRSRAEVACNRVEQRAASAAPAPGGSTTAAVSSVQHLPKAELVINRVSAYTLHQCCMRFCCSNSMHSPIAVVPRGCDALLLDTAETVCAKSERHKHKILSIMLFKFKLNQTNRVFLGCAVAHSPGACRRSRWSQTAKVVCLAPYGVARALRPRCAHWTKSRAGSKHGWRTRGDCGTRTCSV
jgi:hypothetical protein